MQSVETIISVGVRLYFKDCEGYSSLREILHMFAKAIELQGDSKRNS